MYHHASYHHHHMHHRASHHHHAAYHQETTTEDITFAEAFSALANFDPGMNGEEQEEETDQRDLSLQSFHEVGREIRNTVLGAALCLEEDLT